MEATGLSAATLPGGALARRPAHLATADKRELRAWSRSWRSARPRPSRGPGATWRCWRWGPFCCTPPLWRRSRRPGLALVAAGALPACCGLLVVSPATAGWIRSAGPCRWRPARCCSSSGAGAPLAGPRGAVERRIGRGRAHRRPAAAGAGLHECIRLRTGCIRSRPAWASTGCPPATRATNLDQIRLWPAAARRAVLLPGQARYAGRRAVRAGDALCRVADEPAATGPDRPGRYTGPAGASPGRPWRWRWSRPTCSRRRPSTMAAPSSRSRPGRCSCWPRRCCWFRGTAKRRRRSGASDRGRAARRHGAAQARLCHSSRPGRRGGARAGLGDGCAAVAAAGGVFAVGPLLAGLAQVGYNYLRYQGLPNALFRTGYEHEPGFSTRSTSAWRACSLARARACSSTPPRSCWRRSGSGCWRGARGDRAGWRPA